ncbi:isochorismatase family protein [Dactylosporangium sp. NPDC051484]|uniref:isochorismatase family protein n=1 Tax=Dactylosporangium sp. NPDC051484 TaxID=3154942 RepID=UPI00344D3CB5
MTITALDPARAAYEHGYHVTLATDAMADLDLEAHRNSIQRIFPRQWGKTARQVSDHPGEDRRAGLTRRPGESPYR